MVFSNGPTELKESARPQKNAVFKVARLITGISQKSGAMTQDFISS